MSVRAALRPHAAPLAALAAVVVLIFSDAVFLGRVFFERDIHAYWYPQVATFVRTVAQGAWPLWDADEGFGLPLLADPNSQVAYPLTWLNLVLLPASVYRILVLFHTFWAGAGTYALGRRRGLEAFPATVAGACFAASGPFLSAASLYHHFCGASWIPWVLLAAERALAERTVRSAAWLGLAAAGQALAGSAEMCLFSALAIALRIGPMMGGMRADDRRRAAGVMALATLLAAAIGAVQWLPTAMLVRTAGRSRFQAGDSLYWSVHPLGLFDMLVPRWLADVPLAPAARTVLLEGREPFLTSLYFGAVGLVAAALARGRAARHWAVAAVIFSLLALGRHFTPAAALLGVFPLRLLRYPAKYMLPAALFWALLVGSAIQAWRAPWDARQRRRALLAAVLLTLAAAAALLAAAALSSAPAEMAARVGAHPDFLEWSAVLLQRKLHRIAVPAAVAAGIAVVCLRRESLRPLGAGAFALVLAADLLLSARSVNSLAPPELLQHPSPALPLLTPELRERRVLAEEADLPWLNAHFAAGVPDWPREWSWALGMQSRLAPPIGARWGLRGSFDADFGGLAHVAHSIVSGSVQGGGAPGFTRRMLQLGNVGAVIAIQRPFPGLQPLGEFRTVFDVPVRVLAVPDPLPPAYVVGGWRVADNVMEVIRVLGSPDFDPTREVVLEEGPRAVAVPVSFHGGATIRERKPDSVVVDVEASHDAHLVVVEAHQEGWHARVDGRPARVIPANGLFRAVALPAGRHQVEMRYRPWSVTAGAASSAVGLAVTVFLLARRRRSPA